MKNFLIIISCILFINTSIFSQITPANGELKCQNQAFAASVTGNYSSYSWTFSGAGAFPTSSTNSFQSVTCSGTGLLNITLIVTLANGSSATYTSQITISQQPPNQTLVYPNGLSYCSSNSILQSPNTTGLTAGGSYIVTPAMNGFNTTSGAFTPSLAAVGSYDITYTVSFPSTGCTPVSVTKTITVNPTVTPSVSIAASASTICAGTSVTFTATPTNGGAAPTYQWKLNGGNVGTGSTTYTNSSLANTDVVTVEMTANNTCQTGSPATSNGVTMTVTSNVTPSVSVAASASTICAGTSVTFTATPTNGGAAPTYQWKLNGANVGTGLTTYTNSSLANNDVVTVVMTANNTCQTSSTANGNSVTMTVTPNVTPTVSIAASASTICAGTSVTFTATPTNGGAAPTYQWKLNGANVGTGLTTYTNSSLANNDVVTVVMTANNTCQTSATANGNITMSVTPNSTNTTTVAACGTYTWANTGITYSSSGVYTGTTLACITQSLNLTINQYPIVSVFVFGSTTICAGQNAPIIEVTSAINNTFVWKKNGIDIPGASGTITAFSGSIYYSATTTGSYTCVVTNPNTGCSTTSTATIVNVSLPINTSISVSPQFVCIGQPINLNYPANGASIQSVDWYYSDNTPIGTGSPTFILNFPVASGAVYAIITGTNGCKDTSSNYSFGVMPLPPVPVITSSSPPSGTTCSPNCVTLYSNPLPYPNNMSYSWSSGGGSNPTACYNITGSYTLTHSILYSNIAYTPSSLTCSSTSLPASVTINPLPTTPIITASGGLTSTTFCQGSSITLSVPNLPNTDFEWSNGSFTNSIIVSSTGSYSVRIRNTITGCWSNYATYTVTMIPLPTPIITAPPSPICLATGGTVSLSSNSPTGNSWSGCGASGNSSTLSVSVSCLYTLTVTQAGCSASTSLNLTINPRPSAVITQSGALDICAGSCVTLNAVNSPNTLYAWYTTASILPIGTNSNYVACSPGTYYVVITDNTTGCSSQSINYTVTTLTSPINTITIQVPGTNTFCQGGSATLEGPTAPIGTTYTYQWFNTGGFVGSGQNYISTSSGTYYCIITNSNTLCSVQSNSIVITVNPNPIATISPSTNICLGDVLTAIGNNSSITYTYQWFLNDNPVMGSQNNNYISTSAGNVYVRLKDPNGCIGNSSTVTINALPTTPVISGITPFCAGTSTTLSTPLVANCTYTWSPSGGIAGPTPNIYTVSTAGTYSVTITNSNGCSSTSLPYPVIMTPTPITPTISPAGPISLCVGQTQILTATSPSGAGTNLWNGGTPTNLLATTISNSISGSGSYTYTVIINGCSATSAPVIVTFNPNPSIPTLTSSAQTLCAYPTSNVLLTSSPAAPGIAYSWNGGTTPGNNQTNSITPSSNGSGNYFVTHTNTTTGCSSISNSIPVTFNPLPSITITPNGPISYCQSGTVTLSSTVVPALTNPTVYAYSWTGSPAALTSTTSAANLTFLSTSLAGTYTYTLQATNPTTGCVGFSLPQTIQINPNPIATITPSGSSTFCQGSNVILTAGPTNNSYVWSGPSFSGSNLSAITVSETGTYFVTVTNSFGCVNTSPTQTVAVTANPITPIITSPITTAICSGNSLILTFNNPTINTTHTWFETSNGLVQIGGATYAATNPGTYYLVTTSTLSPLCSSSSNLVTVTVNANPSTPIISSNIATPICQGNSVTLSAGSYDPNLTYTWTPSASNAGGSLTDDNINNVTATGSYVVTVSNSNGCNALSLPYTVTVNPLPIVPIVIASGPTTFCAGASVNLIVSNPVVGHIYDWYLSGGGVPVFTGTTYTIINSGIYYVKARNPITLCESNSSTTPITVNPLPTAAITPAGPITVCAGDNLVLTAFNSPGYSFSWGSSNTNVISSSGIYNVTVTLNGCSAISNSVTVNYIPNPSPIIISSPVSLEACYGGSVNLSVGGIFPLTACTYEWFNSAGILVQGPGTNSSYLADSSGTYRVKATSTLGTFCSSFSAPVTVTIHPNIPVSITLPAGSSTTFCEGTPPITLTASPQIGYTYVWSNGGLTSPSINLSLASQSNSYTVTVTNTVTNCSATSAPMPITIYPNPSAPSISPIGPLNSCAGNPLLTLTASPSTFPTYQWKNGPVDVGSNSPSHNPASTGAYSVIATNSNGCSSLPSNSTFITINPTPATPVIIPQTGSPLTFCQGGSINLSATINSGSTYEWFRNGILYITGNPVNITLSGIYTLIETNSVGCSSQASNPITVTVNANSTPVITANGPITFCANPGASVTLQATPGSNLYQWTCVSPSLPIQAPSSSPNFTATQSGTYTVTTTNSNGCISAVSNSIQVIVNPLPTATITPSGPTTFCQGGNVIITANPGPVGYTYLWNTINGTTITNSSSQANTILSSGTYSVKVTNLTTQCFATSSTITITVNPLPTPTITMIAPTPLCQGNTATLTANSNGTGLVYSWSPNFATTNPINVTSSGNFSVTVTDNNGCVGVSPIQTVIVNPNPAAFITPSSLPTLLCQGDTVTLQSSPSSFNYQWIQYNSINGQPSIISTGNQNLPVTNSGTYTVTNYNPSGCFTISDPITVTVNPLPTPSIIANGPTTFCQGSSVFINATGVGITTYQWKVNGQNIPGATSSSYTATSTGSYSVEVVNNNNCSNISSSINVTVNQNPIANINYTYPTPPPILLCPGIGIGLTASPSNMNYIWNSSSNIGIQTNQYLLANTTGSYTVNVTDPLTGCSSVSLPLDVTIIQPGTTPAAVIGMPNILSPLCPNSTISLSGITTNATSYSWTQTSGPLGNLIGANTLNPSFTSGFSSGIVTLTLNTTLDYACNSVSSSQSITITVNPSIPTLSHDTISGPIDQVLCSNIPITPIIFNVLNIPGSGTTVPSVIIDGTSVLANTVYNGISWSFINGLVTISGTPNFGTYTYTVKGIPSGSTSCISDSITGTINSLSPSISISSPDFTNNQVLCIGNTIDPIIYTFTGLISTSSLPPGINQQIASVGSSQTLTLSGIASTEGYYNFAITTETYCGFETLLGEILVIPAISGNTSGIETSTNCDGSLFTLIGGTLNSSINTNYNYLWEFSTSITGPFTPAPGVNTNANYEGAMYIANDTLYFRRVVSAGSCSDTALPVMVQVEPMGTNPNMIGFAGPDQTISLGQSVELVTNGISVSNFDWSPIIGLNSASISNPIASPILTTTYTLTVIDVFGCSYSDDVIVNVLNDFSLTIPSLITPNDDGSNDFWEIPESLFYTGTTVKIINREGQEVYSSSSYDNTWDGTFEGKLLPEATYYYFIQFPNSEITHKGPITILRNIK